MTYDKEDYEEALRNPTCRKDDPESPADRPISIKTKVKKPCRRIEEPKQKIKRPKQKPKRRKQEGNPTVEEEKEYICYLETQLHAQKAYYEDIVKEKDKRIARLEEELDTQRQKQQELAAPHVFINENNGPILTLLGGHAIHTNEKFSKPTEK